MSAMDAVKRCAIYIRVSTAMQRMEGWSLEAQKASLEAFAKARGWKIVGVYADEGKTARKRLKGRKAIFKLLEDVRAGEIDVILFKELDRWFRSVSDFYKVQDVLDECGVYWVSERQPNLGMATKEDRLQVNLLLSVGQNETDSTSDRIKYTQKFLIEQKRWTAGKKTLPRCYTLAENQRVVLDPEQAPYVKAMAEYLIQLGSVRGALFKANNEFGQRMVYHNAASMLRNTMLYGEYRGITDFVEVPLMSKEDWERMQSRMQRNARSTTTRFYIFSGLMRCASCGLNMSGNGNSKEVKSGKKEYTYYRCNAQRRDNLCSNSKNAKESAVEQFLLDNIQEAIAERIAVVQQVIDDHKKKPKKKSNRAQIEAKLKKLKDLYVEDDLTWEEYQKKKEKILSQLIEDEPEPELPVVADLAKIQALLDSGVMELYKDFTPEEKREFWLGIIKGIKVSSGEVVGVEFIE